MDKQFIPLLPWLLTGWFGLVLLRAFVAAAGVRGHLLAVLVVALRGILLRLPLWSVLGIASAIVVGLSLRSEFYAAYAGIGIPLSFALLIASGRIARNSKAERQTEQALTMALRRHDYRWISGYEGIAVDAESGTVAVARGRREGVKCYPIRSIREFEAVQPDLVRNTVYGRGAAAWEAKQQADRDNLRAEIENAQATGLLVHLDDIETPSVHIQMPYRGAEQWLRVLEQLSEGTLARCPAPVVLPS